ncbi:uncharacterized protein CTRU02_214559 [Colletotrichum truncatum]|uniref:Uncharacterized protein n=1 Tax=Colletotrichum truncatum TaxID=5467 RepID=A0ACC3YF43_COLTU|nr:uncharacterized protein CTRU02_12228 [Colletotrichum truncatum]KAF6785017.1 hypothetical protein CTRU02_12228 [Colletotrichum truncatum]
MSLKRKRALEDIFQSRLIKFVIGTPGVEFSVHESSFTRLSAPLRALLTGGMQESIDARVVWDDLETSIFLALVDFAYNGDYATPSLVKASQPETSTKADSEEDCVVKTISISDWMKKFDGQNRRPIIYSLCKAVFEKEKKKSWDGSIGKATYAAEMMDANVTGHDVVFMFHAKLYTLADKYAIGQLKELCLKRIRASLLLAPGNKHVLKAVRKLVCYVYEHTLHGDGLRNLVLRYCIVKIGWLKKCGFVTQMVKGLPTFATDLLLGTPQTIFDQIMGEPWDGKGSTWSPSR